jgi:hypothetical protein
LEIKSRVQLSGKNSIFPCSILQFYSDIVLKEPEKNDSENTPALSHRVIRAGTAMVKSYGEKNYGREPDFVIFFDGLIGPGGFV